MNEKVSANVEAAGETDKPKKVRFHYIKSSAFRSIHADGVFGGVTPRLTIAASFFIERQPIPDQMVYAVGDDGSIAEEIREERISRDGFVRELEATLILDHALAKRVVEWLNEKIAIIEEQLVEAGKTQTGKQVKEGLTETEPQGLPDVCGTTSQI